MNNMTKMPLGLEQIIGAEPGPTVVLLKKTHGNETGGEKVLDLVIENLEDISKGKLIYGVGNPEAALKNVRFIDIDLNRACGKKTPEGYEGLRATELKPILEGANYLIDVHSYLKPGQPIICYPGSDFETLEQLTKHMPISTVIYGKGLWPLDGDHIYLDTLVCAEGGLGMTIESGHLDDFTAIEGIAAGLTKILASILGATFTKDFEIPECKKTYWHAYENIKAEEGFKFEKEYGNFEFIPTGTHFATSNNKDYVTSKDSYILFPKSQENIVVGNEVCILLEKGGKQ